MVKQIPNLFTLINLFAGCIGTVAAFTGNMNLVLWSLIISLVTDFLDGGLAKWLNAQSELGKELDSLSDLVAFGVMPSMLLFQYLQDELLVFKGLAYSSFLIVSFTAIRLAKFNISGFQQNEFNGLPSPANGMLIVGLILVLDSSFFQGKAFIDPVNLMVGFILIDCWLLVAPIEFFSLKFRTLNWRGNEWRWLFLGMALVLCLLLKIFALPFIVLLYIILSLALFFLKS